MDVDRISHYEQRLKALYYKKKFNERMCDVKNKVEGACLTFWGLIGDDLGVTFASFYLRFTQKGVIPCHVSQNPSVGESEKNI